jgi:Ricin-type beta-trefoil lectin domain
VPCSRVGHIFRSSDHWQGQVYTVPGEEVTRNKLRTASIWMDEFADLVKLASAPLPAGMEIGSLDYMRGVRARLQCKSYSWYLNNVFPEILPSADRLMGAMGSGSLKANGYLRSPASGACIDTLNKKQAGESIGAYPCHYLHGTQALVAAADGTIVVAELTFSSCLTRTKGFAAENASLPVVNGKCEDSEILQKWVTHREDNAAAWIHEKEAEGGSAAPRGCLTMKRVSEADDKSPYTLRTEACVEGNADQLWEWETIGSPKMVQSAPKAL